MEKVLVLGCSGSGKSTFSQQLGELTGLPVVHLDSLFWKPGWVSSDESEWNETIEQLLKKDRYILDGNYSRTLEERLKEADSVFYFDFPRYLCFYRAIKRRVQNHGVTRPDMREGCIEKIDVEFLLWIWNFNKRNRPTIMKCLEEVRSVKQVVIFTSPKDVSKYIQTLVHK
ncbi:DNA topology modulation protein [Caldalkalibacillus mannanilyticus]|uniref:DNA topology modulation protein n=1 Tax=Caldalkalibacillus mannanilyticus TaxID=1418 RepID=UPI00046AB08C|nr:DNA topology modulation protein [Caldalkalibacillus mannanilyticus]